jgi:hypothetical protein
MEEIGDSFIKPVVDSSMEVIGDSFIAPVVDSSMEAVEESFIEQEEISRDLSSGISFPGLFPVLILVVFLWF